MTKLYKETDVNALIEKVNGGDWQYNVDDLLSMIDEEVAKTNSANLQAA